MLLLLQSSRGLAALAVAAYHLTIGISDQRYLGVPVLDWLTWRMNLGVDFFFVLSGFIIMRAHSKDIGQPARFTRFVEKRFIRIYPIYWIYLGVFTGLVALGFGTMSSNPDTASKWLTAITLLRFENFKFPISQAWTLCHEVAFYGVFSLLILNKRIGIIVFVIWQFICLFKFEYAQPHTRTAMNTYFSAYNLDFLIGIIAFYLYQNQTKLNSTLVFAFGTVIFSVVLFFETYGYIQKISYIFYAISFGLLILSFVLYESNSHKKLYLWILPFLGDASYSIYLTHEAFEGLFLKTSVKVMGLSLLKDHPYFTYGLVLCCTLLAGCAAHIFIEKFALKFTKSIFDCFRTKSKSVLV